MLEIKIQDQMTSPWCSSENVGTRLMVTLWRKYDLLMKLGGLLKVSKLC